MRSVCFGSDARAKTATNLQLAQLGPRPSELRKECLKHSISAAGDIEELITKLVLTPP